ncbi:tail fiber protein [Cronobacter malonaticus]|uniref:tail fiber protein n=1 Tax=Cronobacter malonaticus TaxID=413503 RepID=UPI000CFF5EFE|nr:tail fiber protein [Cronobacter malonaticus]
MFYIDNDSGVTVMPPVSAQRSAIVRWFSEGDGNNVITWPGMDWFNIVQAELLNTLEEASIQPDKTKLNQLALSIKAIMNKNALLIKNNLSEIKTAGASAQRTARENLDIYDASLNKKGLVQLTSATDSPSETLAATAKAVKIAMDNANARLAKDRNGADIPNKPLFIQNLGLQETVNLAAGAVPSVRRVNGYPLSADIALTAKDVSAIPERGALGDTNLNTLTGSKFGRYFQQYTAKATTANNYPVNVAGALDIIQNGAGNAEGCTQEYRPYHSNVCYRRFYRGDSNVWSSWEYDFTSAGGAINGFVEIAGDNRTITIKPKTANQWYSLFGRKADNTNHFYVGQGANNSDTIQFHNYLTNSRISLVRGGVDVLGKIIPSDFSNFDSRYVKDVRLGTRVVQIMQRGVMYEKPGHVITGLGIIGEVDGDDPAVFRPIQKHINGTWYNVSQV